MTLLADTMSAIADRHPHRSALVIDGHHLSYATVMRRARRIAAALVDAGLPDHRRPACVAILADHSPIAYTALVALALRGHVAVPLDPAHPPAYLRTCLARADAQALIAGREALDRLPHLLRQAGRPLPIVHPGEAHRELPARFRRHRFRALQDLDPSPPSHPPAAPDGPACLLFTPGTTDAPQGVLLHQRALVSHLHRWHQRLALRPGERVAQTFEPGFDLALHTTWSTWIAGATLVVWHRRANHTPAAFIRHHRISHWACLPTLAMGMHRQGDLAPEAFPSLRTTLFGGEPLPASLVAHWARSAPRSRIVHLYGPTEATMGVAAYDCPAPGQPPAAHDGIVSLGHPLGGHDLRIADPDGHPRALGQIGELWLSGPSVIDRYACGGDPHRFARADGRRWFRTGDRVRLDPLGRLSFYGRLDHSFKLRGHHVQLPAIDRVLRRACGHPMACAVGWPRHQASVLGLVGVVATDEDLDRHRLLAHCRRLLPPALVPDAIVTSDHLPTTSRGAIDRSALCRFLDRHPQEV